MFVFSMSSVSANAQVERVPTAAIAINGKTVDGINPIIIDGTYYLPLVKLAKILGYNSIKYEKNTRTYEMTDGSTTIRTTMGGTLAKKSNEYIHIDAPRWINETGFISLAAGGDLFNTDIQYRVKDGSIQVQKPAKYYTVQPKDTLWSISRSLHTSVAQLKTTNNLNSNFISIGQKLKIPSKDKSKELEPVKEQKPIKNNNTYPKTDDIRESIIIEAKKYVGAKYKFGALLSEAPKLFDCSSYTKTVFSSVGITLPRVSRDQASKGEYVKKGDLRVGDLLFFTNKDLYSDGRVGHVGIYIGNGKMIHASSSLGVDITENVLNNRYWSKNYLFAKRILK